MRCVCGHALDRSPAHAKQHWTRQLEHVQAFQRAHLGQSTTRQRSTGEPMRVTWAQLCWEALELYHELLNASESPTNGTHRA